jgi:hypothetical protein
MVMPTDADKSNAGAPGLLSPSPVPEPSSPSIQLRPYSRTSAISSVIDRDDTEPTVRSKSLSVSSNVNTLASSKGSASAEAREQQRAVRTLPRRPCLSVLQMEANSLPCSLGAVSGRRRRHSRPLEAPVATYAQQNPACVSQSYAHAQEQCCRGAYIRPCAGRHSSDH